MSSTTGHIDFGQSVPRHDAPPAEVFGRASTPGDGYPLAKSDGKPYVMARAGEVFGPESILVDSRPQQAGHTASLCSGEAFQISVLLLSTAYLTMLLRSSHHMHTVVRSIFRSGGVDRNIVDECGNASSARFMTSVGLFGIALAALAAVRIVDMLLPQQTIVALPAGIDLAPAVAIAAAAAVAAWQHAQHKAAGWVCASDDMSILGQISRLYFAAGALAVFPLLAPALLSSGISSSIWIILSLSAITLLLLLYLKETFMFFIGKKIHILYWFLYLCSVIALPLSFVCIVAARL